MKIPFVSILLPFLVAWIASGCASPEAGFEDLGRQRALRMQRLRNLHADSDVLSEMRLTVDSMRSGHHDVFYFAAVNVLIDQLFALDRVAEADSMASMMVDDAGRAGDPLALASALRVRGQILYKLGCPADALKEFMAARRLLPACSGEIDVFSTAAAVDEWIWISARNVSDSVCSREAALRYAGEVEFMKRLGWNDSTRHFDVTALALKASALARSDRRRALALSDSASAMRRKDLPARAYEHLFDVRADLDADGGNFREAVLNIDTLIDTHSGFPWFKAEDLLRKARLSARFASAGEVADHYARYIAFHDSLFAARNESRIRELTIVYRSELEEGHRLTTMILSSSLAIILILAAASVFITMRSARRERKKNLLLIRQLHEKDANDDSGKMPDDADQPLSDMERLDRYMSESKAYCDPALGRGELAAAMGCSQDAVARLIRKHRDASVVAYITGFRLEAARRLLEEDPGRPVSEIARDLGFGTARTLQRAFKARYDMTPTQYRDLAGSRR